MSRPQDAAKRKIQYIFRACSMHTNRDLGSSFNIKKLNIFFVNSMHAARDLLV